MRSRNRHSSASSTADTILEIVRTSSRWGRAERIGQTGKAPELSEVVAVSDGRGAYCRLTHKAFVEGANDHLYVHMARVSECNDLSIRTTD